jgi:CBS domain-containing protein
MFMASAALGGAYAVGVQRLFPHSGVYPAAFALVAMGAVFGAASRATFAFIIFAFEITGDYNAVLPLMLVSVIADGVALMCNPTSIMTEKLARRGLRIPTDFEPDVLHEVTVEETMSRDVATVPPDMPVAELARRVAAHDPLVTAHQGLPIVDSDGRLCGIITRSDLLRAVENPESVGQAVLEAGSTRLTVAYPDESLYDAVEKMLHRGVGRLPVVERDDPTRLVGYLGRTGVLSARLRRIEAERVREPGWLGTLFTPAGSKDQAGSE